MGSCGRSRIRRVWLGLSWIVLRADVRDLRNGRPPAGLASFWLVYTWAGAITSFAFGIVNAGVVLVFGLSQLISEPRQTLFVVCTAHAVGNGSKMAEVMCGEAAARREKPAGFPCAME